MTEPQDPQPQDPEPQGPEPQDPEPQDPQPQGPDPHGRRLLRAVLDQLGGLPDPSGDRPADDDEPLGRAAESVAGALADSFLAGDWSRAGLLDSGAHVLGARRLWLRRLVDRVLAGYHRAPTDRPRELAAFVLADPVYRATVRAGRQRPRHRPRAVARQAVPTRTVRRPWPVPRLDDVAAVADFLGLTDAELDWFADRRSLERRVASERLRHYRYRWIPKRSGARLLEVPKPRLKALQRRLLRELVGLIPTHPAVHGFVPNRSVHTYAAAHAGRAMVARIDLAGFFASVTAGRVYGIFRTAGYPEPVAHTLTGLVTVATPASVLATPAAAAAGWTQRRRLARPHLPQGAPTSPALANLCGYRLDCRMAGLADAFTLRYTRYADDLALSGPVSAVFPALTLLAAIAADEGFQINEAKTRLRGRSDRQLIGGLVVNVRPAAPRDEYDRLRAILHNAARTGPDAQNRDGHPDFRGHLLGRIGWLGQDHPARAARLRAAFDRIEW